MWRKIFLIGMVIFSWQHLSAQVVELKSTAPDRYIVTPGDTIWSLADRYLTQPWQWNDFIKGGAATPIYPGNVLQLKDRNDEPYLKITGTKTASTPIALLSLASVEPYSQYDQIITAQQFFQAPYVLRTDTDHLLRLTGERIIARSVPITDTQFTIVRRGLSYTVPNAIQKNVAITLLGKATVQSRNGNQTLLTVDNATTLVEAGDRLLVNITSAPRVPAVLMPAPTIIKANILAELSESKQIGISDVVVLNYGAQQNAAPGQVLKVWPLNANLNTPAVGLLVVFRVFDDMSFALVTQAQQPLAVSAPVRSAQS